MGPHNLDFVHSWKLLRWPMESSCPGQTNRLLGYISPHNSCRYIAAFLECPLPSRLSDDCDLPFLSLQACMMTITLLPYTVSKDHLPAYTSPLSTSVCGSPQKCRFKTWTAN